MKNVDKILLIDDDPIANYLHGSLLKKLKLADEIIVRQNGIEALKLLKQCEKETRECPPIILLDINMPVMDGFDFLQEFKNFSFTNNDKVTIVALTTSTMPRDIEKLKSLGVKKYINKPLCQEKLKQIFEGHVVIQEEDKTRNKQ